MIKLMKRKGSVDRMLMLAMSRPGSISPRRMIEPEK